MKPKSAAVLMTAALVGCSLAQRELRDVPIPRIGGAGVDGERVAPKQCVLRVMVAARPRGDAALGESIWRVADEQAIDADVRRVLEANGLRAGVASGELPQDVLDVLAEQGRRRAEDHTVVLPDGEATLIDTNTPKAPTHSLLLGLNGKLVGKDYQDARGVVRVTASQSGDDGVTLRVVPEVHHGPVQRGWGVTGGGATMTPQQIVARSGQQEDAFREMAGTIVVKPGQIVVLGGRPEKRGSLGDFLFSEPEGHGDLPADKVVFLWASRPEPGAPIDEVPVGLMPFDPPAEPRPEPKPEG